MFYVYVLRNPKTGALYYGFSSNLKQRFAAHQAMPKHVGWKLIYYEAYLNEQDARACSSSTEPQEVISIDV